MMCFLAVFGEDHLSLEGSLVHRATFQEARSSALFDVEGATVSGGQDGESRYPVCCPRSEEEATLWARRVSP